MAQVPSTPSTPSDDKISRSSDNVSPYTIWTVRKRRFITILLGYLALASSFTANAYFPLVNVLADRFDTSLQAINLTITVSFIFQGIAPSFWSPLSDVFGRRPVYLGTFLLYTAGSLGLVLSGRSYVALMISRAVQSLGSASVVSLSYAVVADICVHSERGSFLSPMMAAANVGALFGPSIGGGSALATESPEWCFRAYLIFGATGLVLVGFCLPETLRAIVGNGSVKARGVWKTWERAVECSNLRRRDCEIDEESQLSTATRALESSSKPFSTTSLGVVVKSPTRIPEAGRAPTGRGRFVVPNPIPVLRIIGYLDSCLVLWLAASPYTLWFSVQTAITPILSSPPFYLDPFHIGLCFLAGGAGIIVGGFIAGKLMDVNYRHVARKAGISIDAHKGDNIADFPIEHARSRWSIRIIIASLILIIGYGWTVMLSTSKVHLAALLVMQLLIACRCTVLHQIYSSLLTDVFPEKTGTAAAANNIVRCTLSGVMVASLEPLAGALGWGWLYTLLGVVDASGCIGAILGLRRWGKAARDRRGEGGLVKGT